MNQAQANGVAREASWPVERMRDLHLNGSEPRIFPGVISRTQRRDSLAKGNTNGSVTGSAGNASVLRLGGDAAEDENGDGVDDEHNEENGGLEED